ncbi:DEKNAAC103217 [Brettanomyces naardenensis]|uniref:DEKNAAC103217 n=1 Tax=Brettanomyces naardenensis TaxID=13370 RepID=A0A448YMW8_BRENA|nr:DEKNAAC103217 [Brettanomyces naardenensis]
MEVKDLNQADKIIISIWQSWKEDGCRKVVSDNDNESEVRR